MTLEILLVLIHHARGDADRLLLLVMLTMLGFSAFINNTAVVAMFRPACGVAPPTCLPVSSRQGPSTRPGVDGEEASMSPIFPISSILSLRPMRRCPRCGRLQAVPRDSGTARAVRCDGCGTEIPPPRPPRRTDVERS